ncbi:hypothetical protein [Phormidesmis priestleyi]
MKIEVLVKLDFENEFWIKVEGTFALFSRFGKCGDLRENLLSARVAIVAFFATATTTGTTR